MVSKFVEEIIFASQTNIALPVCHLFNNMRRLFTFSMPDMAECPGINVTVLSILRKIEYQERFMISLMKRWYWADVFGIIIASCYLG